MKITLLFILLTLVGLACQRRITSMTTPTYIHPSIADANRLGIDDESNQQVLLNYEGGYSGVLLAIPNGKVAQENGDSVYVSGLYVDATKVCNLHYRAFVAWMYRIHERAPDLATKLLPDTSIWVQQFRNESIGKTLMEQYFRSPMFDYYPVVGVSWQQAQAYAAWRTDRINESILVDRQYIAAAPQDQNQFNTYNFLNGRYGATSGAKPMVVNKSSRYERERNVNAADGILLPNYRLPTLVELKLAAKKAKNYNDNKALKAFVKKVQEHTKKYPKPIFYNHLQYDLPHLIINEAIEPAPYCVNDKAGEWTQQQYNTSEKYNTLGHVEMDADNSPNRFIPAWIRIYKPTLAYHAHNLPDTSGLYQFDQQHTATGPYKGFRCVMPNLW